MAWCATCARAVVFATHEPAFCATCGCSRFVCVQIEVVAPPKGYRLSENDRRLLHALHIEP